LLLEAMPRRERQFAIARKPEMIEVFAGGAEHAKTAMRVAER